MRPWDVKALVRPPFTDEDFTATKLDTTADKAWFANALCNFIASDCKRSLWTKRLYNRLSLGFGHIAHYSDAGFWDVFFTSTQGKLDFLGQTMSHRCFGDPAYTYSDVERAIRTRLKRSGIVSAYQALHAAEIENVERAMLARLSAKYQGTLAQPQVVPHVAIPSPTIPRPRRDQPPSGQASLL